MKENKEKIPFRLRLARFMIGRNGPDALGKFLYILLFLTLVVGLFVRHIAFPIAEGVLLVLYFFRFFSKNTARRRRENALFLRLTGGITQFFRRQHHRFRDRKTHVYRKCPSCRHHLRLPRVVGEHTASCPVCHHRFSVTVRK